MSHITSYTKYDENECSGPRPPVPGEESRVKKMTEGGAAAAAAIDNLRSSPPSYLNWARTLNHLLEDRDGVELFKKYVEEEAPGYNDHLNFYFACEGLKQQTDAEKIKQIIGAIYRFLRKSQLSISEELRRTIKAGLKNEIVLTPAIYDPLQQQVEITIRDHIYPTFLCSDMYIMYIQQMAALHERFSTATTSTSSSSGGGGGGIGGGSSYASTTGSAAAGVYATAAPSALPSMPSTSKAAAAAAAAATAAAAAAAATATQPPSAFGYATTAMGGGPGGPSGGATAVGAGASCSASGSIYGPSTSASSSGSVSATDTLPRSSTLPTLHEDSELSMCDDFEKLTCGEAGGAAAAAPDMPMRLTRDLLLATQKRRLEIRPPGAHGYVYTPRTNTSYVPNSRVDSERASISSGGRTDSDTMSLSSSIDGRPYIQRRQSSTESRAIRQSALANKETNTFQVIPRTQRLHTNEHRPLKESELLAVLIPKLEEVKRQQELDERARLERFPDDVLPNSERLASDRAFAEAIREKFALEEDNDQAILDQHVSRVWKDQTPHRSPGTSSPGPPLPTRRRTGTHDSGMLSDGAMSLSGNSMKHSKSMPEHSSSTRKLTNKWPSTNTDSGISLFSADTLMKYKEISSSRSGSSTASKLEEAKRRLEDETRRSRRYTQHQQQQLQQQLQQQQLQLQHQHHHPQQQQQHMLPMQQQQHQHQPHMATTFSSSSSGSSSLQHHHHHHNQLAPPPPLPAKTLPLETTTVVFSFCDEEYPYRSKIPGTQPTLRQFKDYLPKKGHFRFFFKTHCEDPDSPVIQEEIVNDTDILPLFEGKVMGLVKPAD